MKSFAEIKTAKSKLQSIKAVEAYKSIAESKNNVIDYKALLKFIRSYNPAVVNEEVDILLSYFGCVEMTFSTF